MRTILLVSLLFTAAIGRAQPPATNLIDILPHIEAFGRAMGIDLPHPLTVANVTLWHAYDGPFPPSIANSSQIKLGKQHFTWDAHEQIMQAYADTGRGSHYLYKYPYQTPACLLAVDKGAKVMTTNEAIALAQRIRGNLVSLGHNTNWCGKISVTRPQWKDRDLPIYDIGWQWTRTTNDEPYIHMEIDGLRRKPNTFYSLQGSLAEQMLDGKRMPWSEPDH